MSALVEFIHKGGVMMYPLILCSIALVTVVIERAITMRKAASDGDALIDGIKKAYTPGAADTSAALAVCAEQKGVLSRIFARGIRNAHRPADSIEMAIEQEAMAEQPLLEANLAVLKTIVNVSPLLGLLGTIAGMISSFHAASRTGLSNPTEVLGGISEALISTATGISLAVVGFVCYNYFANLARKMVDDVEFYGAELVNVLTGRVD